MFIRAAARAKEAPAIRGLLRVRGRRLRSLSNAATGRDCTGSQGLPAHVAHRRHAHPVGTQRLAAQKGEDMISFGVLWRNGRVVEGGSLENCCAARYRGFKSYFLRQTLSPRLVRSRRGFVLGDGPFARIRRIARAGFLVGAGIFCRIWTKRKPYGRSACPREQTLPTRFQALRAVASRRPRIRAARSRTTSNSTCRAAWSRRASSRKRSTAKGEAHRSCASRGKEKGAVQRAPAVLAPCRPCFSVHLFW